MKTSLKYCRFFGITKRNRVYLGYQDSPTVIVFLFDFVLQIHISAKEMGLVLQHPDAF